MIENINEHIQVLDWADARGFVKKGNKDLFEIIDAISPDNTFKFIKMRYPYGTMIMENDSLFVPDKLHTTTPLEYAEIPKKIKNELSYRSIPFGFITENTFEIFKEYSDKVFCVCLSGPHNGIQLGIFEFFGLTTCYSVTAGARSVYMVPKISETRYHNRILKKFSISGYPPKSILKHWHVFKSLYASGKFDNPWETEVIYLGKKWDQMIHNADQGWINFKNYIYTKGFEHSSFGRKQVVLNLVWEKIVALSKEEGMKPDPYTIDTLKHLIYIFLGALSASRPSTDNYAGPLLEIQKNYIECYGLNQIPTIMRPYEFNMDDNIPVYYSMQHPMLLSSMPNLRKLDTVIQEINSLITLKDFFVSQLGEIGNIKLDEHYLRESLRKMKLSYFHGDMYSYGNIIHPTKKMPELDGDFLFSPISMKDQFAFAENGSFIKGCIKLSSN